MADLHLTADRANPAEVVVIDAALVDIGLDAAVVHETDRLVRGGTQRKNQRRHGLLPALHALQKESGWISRGGLNYISDVLQVPPAEAYGVASFYELFRVESAPESDGDITHVCVDAPCQLMPGALAAEGPTAGEVVHQSPCLGQCDRPTAQFVQGRRKPDIVSVDRPSELWDLPQKYNPALRLLQRVGRIDPASIDAYVDAGGYKALSKAFAMGPEQIVDEIVSSGLVGRGGAGFPTGIKWRSVAAEGANEKYVVANADESEPGTFKDRTVMENDPFALVEAMTIAGFAVGASKGWIYIRGEYPLATERLEKAIAEAHLAGFLGDRIARSAFSFEIEVRRGAGAYICGEETALFNSLEGFRGEPRQKPPFPTTSGLFGAPTVINNPETLLNVLEIVEGGGKAYSELGTSGSNGRKLFCLSGHVARPGTYEVEFGPTIRDLLQMAGGPVGELRAILLGGAAGSFVGPEGLDMPLTAEAARDAGLSLGSGVVIAFNDSTNFAAVVARLAEFFRNESCGQCVPCRVGTVRQHELLVRTGTNVSLDDVAHIAEMDQVMKDASICGLGHTASTAVLSAIKLGLVGGVL